VTAFHRGRASHQGGDKLEPASLPNPFCVVRPLDRAIWHDVSGPVQRVGSEPGAANELGIGDVVELIFELHRGTFLRDRQQLAPSALILWLALVDTGDVPNGASEAFLIQLFGSICQTTYRLPNRFKLLYRHSRHDRRYAASL
jgi:hypothetical protein